MEPAKNKGGRKPKSDEAKKKLRSIYATDAEWKAITAKADEQQMEVSPFVVMKSLA